MPHRPKPRSDVPTLKVLMCFCLDILEPHIQQRELALVTLVFLYTASIMQKACPIFLCHAHPPDTPHQREFAGTCQTKSGPWIVIRETCNQMQIHNVTNEGRSYPYVSHISITHVYTIPIHNLNLYVLLLNLEMQIPESDETLSVL